MRPTHEEAIDAKTSRGVRSAACTAGAATAAVAASADVAAPSAVAAPTAVVRVADVAGPAGLGRDAARIAAVLSTTRTDGRCRAGRRRRCGLPFTARPTGRRLAVNHCSTAPAAVMYLDV